MLQPEHSLICWTREIQTYQNGALVCADAHELRVILERCRRESNAGRGSTMKYWIWQGMAGAVVGIGLDMTGMDFGWGYVGIAAFIIFGTQICELIAGKRP